MLIDNYISETAGSNETLLNVKEMAKRFNISVRHVYRLVARGDLPRPFRIGRCVRWSPLDVERFEAALMQRRLADAKTVEEIRGRLAELQRSGGRKALLGR
jgi:excisionase family DNA binding protein